MGICSLQQFSKAIQGNKILCRSNCGSKLPQVKSMAANGADNIASDRASQLALRVNRNPGGAFMCALGNLLAFLCGSALLRGLMLSVWTRPGTPKNASLNCLQ
jgi:hypothetical protein